MKEQCSTAEPAGGVGDHQRVLAWQLVYPLLVGLHRKRMESGRTDSPDSPIRLQVLSF